MRNLILAAAVALGTATAAQAAIPLYPTPGVVNASDYAFTAAADGDIVAYFAGHSAGDTLVFKIRVVNTGDYFYSQRSQNADGITHVFSANYGGGDWGIPAGVYVGFEDLYGGGDLDYDDLRFVFTNVGGGEVGGIPEPATWAMLITGFGLVGMAARRRRPASVLA